MSTVKATGIRASLQQSLSIKRCCAVEESVRASPEEIKAMRAEFLSLQKMRLEVQSQPPESEVRKKHLASLEQLYWRAKKAGCELFEYGGCPDPEIINTELTRFGSGIPDARSLPLNDDETVDPKVLVDSQSGDIFYLESDGRHVTAFSRTGKMLWHRDPFEEARLKPYRVSKPVIVEFEFDRPWPGWLERNEVRSDGKAVGMTRVIRVVFNSSQEGQIDLVTGKFIFGGQD